MSITTSRTNQSAIIKFYSQELEKNNEVSVVKSSRGGLHLRINYRGDFNKLMNSILPCEIIPSDQNISGSFTTYELKIKQQIPGAIVGDKIYFVVTVRSTGIISNKELVPDKLGLTGRDIMKYSFLTESKNSIKKATVPDNIKAFLSDLIDASMKPTGLITSNHIESISESDLNVIAKDFGEISGALWFMNQYKKDSTSIFYPSDAANPLIDYYIKVGTKKIAVSAKAKEGAPPSINAIAAILKTIKYTEPQKEGARKAIIAISEKSTVDGIIEASKDINSKGYQWLKKNLFKNTDFNAIQCETVLASLKKPEDALKLLAPFYTAIGRSASSDITNRIFANKQKRYGLIISPMGYSLVDELNSIPVFKEVLNDAAKSIMVSQVFMNINKNNKTVSYNVKEFAASSFKFFYNANAGQPSLKKISFKMEK